MRVRFLQRGEEKKWYDLMGDESDASFTQTSDYCWQSHIVVEDNNIFVGGMELIIDKPEFVILFNPIVKSDNTLSITKHLLYKGIETAKSMNTQKLFSLIHKSNDQFKVIQNALQDLNFKLGMEKNLYRRKPEPVAMPEHISPLVYRSLKEIGDKNFLEIFKRVYEPDIFESDFRKGFWCLKRMAQRSKRFYPEDWELAFINDEAVGLTLPQLHDEHGELGSNFHLGVIKNYRKKGIGSTLQRRAIMSLIKRGVKSIVGSTYTKNHAMINIFRALSYDFIEHQYFYVWSGLKENIVDHGPI